VPSIPVSLLMRREPTVEPARRRVPAGRSGRPHRIV